MKRLLTFGFAMMLATPAFAQAPAAAAAPAAPAAVAAPVLLSIDAASSSITYHLVHKLHKIDGASKKVDGKVRILPTGQAQVMVRVPTESFDSGNSNRDAHMKDTVEAAKFPVIELKAAADGVAMPTSFPATVEKTLKGKLSFHGVDKQIELPVKVLFNSANSATATAQLNISMDEFKIERPSLMFVKVDDALKIDVNLTLKN